jgi:hypothetical protein
MPNKLSNESVMQMWKTGNIPAEGTADHIMKQAEKMSPSTVKSWELAEAAAKNPETFAERNANMQSVKIRQALVAGSIAYATLAPDRKTASEYANKVEGVISTAQGLPPRQREAMLANSLLDVYGDLSKEVSSKSQSAPGVRTAQLTTYGVAGMLAESYASPTASPEFTKRADHRLMSESMTVTDGSDRKSSLVAFSKVMEDKHPALLERTFGGFMGQIFGSPPLGNEMSASGRQMNEEMPDDVSKMRASAENKISALRGLSQVSPKDLVEANLGPLPARTLSPTTPSREQSARPVLDGR